VDSLTPSPPGTIRHRGGYLLRVWSRPRGFRLQRPTGLAPRTRHSQSHPLVQRRSSEQRAASARHTPACAAWMSTFLRQARHSTSLMCCHLIWIDLSVGTALGISNLISKISEGSVTEHRLRWNKSKPTLLQSERAPRKVDTRLPGKRNSNSHGVRPVY
jgi:hypothetical protein